MSSVVRIEVEFDSEGKGVRGVRQLGDEFGKLPSKVRPSNDALGNTAKNTREFSQEQELAKRSLELLGRQLGVEIPRAAQGFIVALKGVAPVLSAAFRASAIIAIGMALFEAGKELYEWIDGSNEAAEAAKKNREEIEKLTESYEQYTAAIEALKQKKGLVGLEGSGRTKQEASDLKSELDRARADYSALSAQYNRLYLQSTRPGYTKENRESRDAALAKLAEGSDNGTDIQSKMNAAQEKWEKLRIEYDTKILELNHEIAGELKRQSEESKKSAEEAAKAVAAYRLETEKLRISTLGPAAKIGAQRETDITAAKQSGISDEDVAARISAINAKAVQDLVALGQASLKAVKPYNDLQQASDEFSKSLDEQSKKLKEVINFTDQMSKGNEDLARSLAIKQYGPSAGLQIDLESLEKQKQLYADNAEAIAAIEERKKLLIMQNNLEIAEDAKSKFEKSAQAIEGFFQRVFLTARSFSDVWKQLWTQSVEWVVSQFARMVAGWLSAHNRMASASGMGGYGGGATATNYASAAGGIALSGLSSGGGGGFSLDALLNGGSGGAGSSTGTTGSGAISGGSQFSLGGSLGTLGLVAAAGGLGGTMLASYGVNSGSSLLGGIGGAVTGASLGYMASTTMLPGGLMIGWGLGMGIGAGIGALIGIFSASRRRNQQKRASAAIHEQYLAAAKEAVANYRKYKSDYDSAVSSLSGSYASAVSQLQSLGTPGSNTIQQITESYNSSLSALDGINRSRGYAATRIAGLPVPEFATGSSGILPGSGPFAAILHGGEAVLNPRAAAKLGSENVKALNEGRSGGGGDTYNVYVTAADAQGWERMLKRHRASTIRFLRQEKAQGAL
jgi:hypothetical protein